FLPPKGKERKQRLAQLQTESRTIVLYESPHRLLKTLTDLSTALDGDRSITLARELTKRYETFWRGTLTEAIGHYQKTEPRGEFTVVITGFPPQSIKLSEDELVAQLKALLDDGLSPSQASRQLAQTTGLPKRDIYQLSLGLDSNP
ncbi:MAG: SAM-dependent methyltransferase, partial [Cyanobacteria bacterium P01_G01_bin.38]